MLQYMHEFLITKINTQRIFQENIKKFQPKYKFFFVFALA